MRLTDKKRKNPTMQEKLAATLLQLKRVDADGNLAPIIDREWAKTKTAKEICAGFDFDHWPVAVSLGGTNHPTNLDPKLRATHRKKTSTQDAKINAKIRRSLKEQKFVVQWPEDFEPPDMDIAVVHKSAIPTKKKWPSPPMAGTVASGLKKSMSGKVSKRERGK